MDYLLIVNILTFSTCSKYNKKFVEFTLPLGHIDILILMAKAEIMMGFRNPSQGTCNFACYTFSYVGRHLGIYSSNKFMLITDG